MSVEDKRDNIQSGKKEPFPPVSSSQALEQVDNGFGELVGCQIGPYKLLSILGEGGYAQVYLAEQDKPIRRFVAFKIIKPGMDSKQVIARFEAERQALALLDHPNIAHVFDAGVTETGHPYFLMEYVEGLSITKHCDQQELGIEERLKLYIQVCDAVQHAHQKGIIHRDLKPSNILVSTHRNKAVPKIIDFGVAKAITEPLTERTLVTEQGQLLGTPEYMSPEQLETANQDIDTRSDIYSLGVLLYVLLTGALPFDSKKLRRYGIDRMRQVICEEDPETPSTRLSHLGEEAREAAHNRRTELGALVKRLHNELEWIPLKAMRKEREHRYRSASELADDIQNYLNSSPLIAGPLGMLYRLKKFVGRNRALVTATGTVVVVLIVGIIASTLFAVKANQARNEAQAVSDFLRYSVLESLDPFKVGGTEITIRSVLDAASEGLEEKFTGTPLAEAEIRHTLGFAYWSIGLYERAELHQGRAVEIYLAKLGPNHPTTLQWTRNLASVYYYNSRYQRAEQILTRVLQSMQNVLGEEHDQTLNCMHNLSFVYCMVGCPNEAEQLCIKALETIQRTRSEEYSLSLPITCGLAFSYYIQGRYDEAEQLFAKLLDSSRRLCGERHFITLSIMRGLAEQRWELGHYDEAEQLLAEAVDGWRVAWGQDHPETLLTIADLAWLYHIQGQNEQAESLFDQVLETSRRVLRDPHIVSLHATHGLSAVYLGQKRYDEAEPLLNKALEMGNRLLGDENWYTLRVMNTLGRLYMAQELYDKTDLLLQEVLETRRRVLGHDHPATYTTMNDLAILYKKQQRYEEAEQLLIDVVEGRRLKLGDTHPHSIESINNLIDLYEASNKSEKANEWREKLP